MVQLLRMQIAVWLLCAVPFGAEGAQYWRKLRFTEYWTFQSHSWYEGSRQLAFRAAPGQILFTMQMKPGPPKDEEQPLDSLIQFVLDLKTGKFRRAQSSEWDAASRIAPHVDSPFRESPVITKDVQAWYEGHAFHAENGKDISKVKLSPDGMWLAVMSATGSFPEGFDIFSPTYGRYRVEIFRVSTGKKVTELSHFVFGRDPDEGFDSASWISDRHFLLPTEDGSSAWLCDLSPLEPSGPPALDFVPSQAEIIGFWQDPPVDNGSRPLKIHTVVRVPRPFAYGIRGNLTGRSQYGDNPSNSLTAFGMISVDSYWNVRSDSGPFRFLDVELLDGWNFLGKVLASAADLGPTERHPAMRSTSLPRGPQHPSDLNFRAEPPPLPVAVVPYLGSGMHQTFTFFVSDVNGVSDIATARVLIQSDREIEKACAFTFSLSNNTISLLNDEGHSPVNSLPFNGAASLQNSQCKISKPSVATESRNSVQLRTDVEFSRSFANRRNIYLDVENKEDRSSSWQWLGSWYVSPE